MPPETQSDTLTPESIAIQVLEENSDLAKQYAGGNLATLPVLQEKALAFAAGRVNEAAVNDTLLRKLGASI